MRLWNQSPNQQEESGRNQQTNMANRSLASIGNSWKQLTFNIIKRTFSTSSSSPASNPSTAVSKSKRKKKKNLFEVAQFLPNWGIGYQMAKTHWSGVAYQITKINLYKVSAFFCFHFRVLRLLWWCFCRNDVDAFKIQHFFWHGTVIVDWFVFFRMVSMGKLGGLFSKMVSFFLNFCLCYCYMMPFIVCIGDLGFWWMLVLIDERMNFE